MNDRGVIPCSASDIRRLTAFRQSEGGAAGPEEDEYARWLYRNAAQNDSLFRCEDDGRITAHACGHRAALRVQGRELAAVWLIGLFVAPSGRRRGLGTKLVREIGEKAALGMSVDVSVAARGAFLRAGWQLLGNLPVYVRAIDPKALLREKRRPKLAAALGTPLRFGMAALRAAEAGAARLHSLRLEEVERFDERCDELWRKVCVELPIAVRRDAAYAARRFEGVRWHSYRRFHLIRGGALEAYAVVRTEQRGGLLVAEIVDYLCPARSLRALFAGCARKFGAEGCEAIYCVSQDARAEAAFKRAGFVRRDSGWPFFVHPNGLDLQTVRTVLELGNWFLTRADSNLDRPRLAGDAESMEPAQRLEQPSSSEVTPVRASPVAKAPALAAASNAPRSSAPPIAGKAGTSVSR